MVIEHFLVGWHGVASLQTISLIGGGVFLGLILGAVPGLTATLGVALLLPLTFGLTPLTGQATLIGVFVGGISGGLVSATLLGVPGTPSSIATTFDAFPMAKAGHSKKALKVGILSSFIGGLISGVILILVAPQLAKIALRFGPYEYFLMAVFGLTIITSLGTESRSRSFISAGMGLLVALFGMDPVDGAPRFTFGLERLDKGFSLIPTLLGLFVFPQLFAEIKNIHEKYFFSPSKAGENAGFGFSKIIEHWVNFVRSGLIGTGLGILPGVGGAIANFVCYDQAQKGSRTPEEFGTGTEEGIIASETGNNATTGGALVPMLTLGIPGDAVTAIILGGLMIHGIQPGPLLFMEQIELVYGIFIAFFIANIFMVLIQMFLGVRLFSLALQIPKPILIPIVIVMCVAGVYAIDYQVTDIWVLLLFGLLGYYMKKYKYPIPAAVLGVILGPLAEKNLRLSLMHSNGSLLPFVTRPICLIIMAVTVVSAMLSFRLAHRAQRQ